MQTARQHPPPGEPPDSFPSYEAGPEFLENISSYDIEHTAEDLRLCSWRSQKMQRQCSNILAAVMAEHDVLSQCGSDECFDIVDDAILLCAGIRTLMPSSQSEGVWSSGNAVFYRYRFSSENERRHRCLGFHATARH